MSGVLRYVPLALAGFVVLVGIAIAVGKLLRGPSTVEHEAVADAPPAHTPGCDADSCDPWCPLLPPAPTVVAGDDLAWQADLARFYADYDVYRNDLRLPGERAS